MTNATPIAPTLIVRTNDNYAYSWKGGRYETDDAGCVHVFKGKKEVAVANGYGYLITFILEDCDGIERLEGGEDV